MVVVVGVDREAGRRARPEQADVFGMPADHLGFARTADVPIETDHLIGRAHDQVQIVADQEHAAAALLADAVDQRVQLELAVEVDPLYGLVEDQQSGLTHQRPREHHPLQLAARQFVHRGLRQMAGADGGEHGRARAAPGADGQEPAHGQRQDRIHPDPLRHVADDQPRLTPDLSRSRFEQAEEHADQSGLAGPVRPDQRNHLACPDAEVDGAEQLAAPDPDRDRLRLDQQRRRGLPIISSSSLAWRAGNHGTRRGLRPSAGPPRSRRRPPASRSRSGSPARRTR